MKSGGVPNPGLGKRALPRDANTTEAVASACSESRDCSACAACEATGAQTLGHGKMPSWARWVGSWQDGRGGEIPRNAGA